MSSNPYAQHEPYGAGPSDYAQPPRVSGLAVTSLICSLICCIPGVSLIGALLGGFAIVRISQAQGRLSGRGFAIAGLVLGLLFTMVWIGLSVGLARALGEFSVFGETMQAVEQRDFNRVRQSLTPGAASVATDQRLEEFRAEIAAEWGGYQRMPRGVGEWLNAYGEIIQRAGQQQVQVGGGRDAPIPLYYDNGLAMVVFYLDAAAGAGPRGAALSSNIIVYDQQGNPIALVPPGTPRQPRGAGAPQAPPAGPTEPPQPPVDDPGAPDDSGEGGEGGAGGAGGGGGER